MKANKLFLLASLLLSGSMIPITAQNKKEKKQQREQAVREAVDAKAYKINVDRVMPMKGGSKHLTSDYSLEIRNDSVYSYLPYFGVAYNVPYGGGKGLNFSAPLSEYTSTYSKKGNAKITLKVRNEEDNYLYNITIYPNGSSNIQVTPTNRQSISFSGEMDLKKKERTINKKGEVSKLKQPIELYDQVILVLLPSLNYSYYLLISLTG